MATKPKRSLVYTLEETIFIGVTNAYLASKQDATERGIPFELELGDYSALVFSKCFYCKRAAKENALLVAAKTKRNAIDRIDNSKGYLTENTVAICRPCHSVKGYFNLLSLKRLGRIARRTEDFLKLQKRKAKRAAK